jgi:DNA repair protein RadC
MVLTKKNAVLESAVNPLFQIAEVELVYRTKVKPADRIKITGSKDLVNCFYQYFEDSIEHVESFYLLLLNRANKVIGIKQISLGGVAGTVADPKVIFQTALKANASGIIVAHNHPSGNTQPSQADIQLTQRLKDAGKLLEIQLLDHVILTSERSSYYSFADEGIL